MPQGNLAERIRAAGAGIGAFFTPTGVGTPLAEGKETREIDGRGYVLEYPIHGDVALIKAHRADELGNLVYRKTARNFGPVMATAAATTDRPGRRDRRGRRARPRDTSSRRASTSTASCASSRRPGYVGRTTMSTLTGIDETRWPRVVARGHPARLVRQPRHRPAHHGRPTTCRPDSGVMLHTENGMLGMGPAAHRRRDRPRPDQRRQDPGHRAARARRTSTTPTPSR